MVSVKYVNCFPYSIYPPYFGHPVEMQGVLVYTDGNYRNMRGRELGMAQKKVYFYAVHLYNASWVPKWRRVLSKIKRKYGLNPEKLLGKKLYNYLKVKY